MKIDLQNFKHGNALSQVESQNTHFARVLQVLLNYLVLWGFKIYKL